MVEGVLEEYRTHHEPLLMQSPGLVRAASSSCDP